MHYDLHSNEIDFAPVILLRTNFNYLKLQTFNSKANKAFRFAGKYGKMAKLCVALRENIRMLFTKWKLMKIACISFSLIVQNNLHSNEIYFTPVILLRTNFNYFKLQTFDSKANKAFRFAGKYGKMAKLCVALCENIRMLFTKWKLMKIACISFSLIVHNNLHSNDYILHPLYYYVPNLIILSCKLPTVRQIKPFDLQENTVKWRDYVLALCENIRMLFTWQLRAFHSV